MAKNFRGYFFAAHCIVNNWANILWTVSQEKRYLSKNVFTAEFTEVNKTHLQVFCNPEVFIWYFDIFVMRCTNNVFNVYQRLICSVEPKDASSSKSWIHIGLHHLKTTVHSHICYYSMPWTTSFWHGNSVKIAQHIMNLTNKTVTSKQYYLLYHLA